MIVSCTIHVLMPLIAITITCDSGKDRYNVCLRYAHAHASWGLSPWIQQNYTLDHAVSDFLSDVHFSNFVTVLLAVLRMRTPLFLGVDGSGIV